MIKRLVIYNTLITLKSQKNIFVSIETYNCRSCFVKIPILMHLAWMEMNYNSKMAIFSSSSLVFSKNRLKLIFFLSLFEK